MRYVANGGDVRTGTSDKETPFANGDESRATYTESVLYHSVDRGISKTKAGTGVHVYVDDPLNHVYQYAEPGWEGQTRRMDTERTDRVGIQCHVATVIIVAPCS